MTREENLVVLNPDDLTKLARAIAATREDEIDCDECFEQMDRFVEMKLSGLDAAAAMPLMQNHLDKCGDCREEFEALLEALRMSEASSSRWGNMLGAITRLWRRVWHDPGPETCPRLPVRRYLLLQQPIDYRRDLICKS